MQGAPPIFGTASSRSARARAIGKSVVYLFVAFLAALAVSAALKEMTGRDLQGLMRSDPLDALLAHSGLLIALVILPTAFSLRLWKEPVAYAGWSAVNGGRFAILGVASGAGLITVIVFTLWLSGAWSGSFGRMSVLKAAGMTLLSALLWLAQSAHEEGLHRGYAFVQLSRAVSFWPAAVFVSVWFMWGHVANTGATPISLASAGLIAMVLAYSFWRTGSLWFALGFHFAWNFTQSFVFGLTNSGNESSQSLLTSSLEGPALLTGGTAGPEGSLLCIAATIALAAIVRLALPSAQQTGFPGVSSPRSRQASTT